LSKRPNLEKSSLKKDNHELKSAPFNLDIKNIKFERRVSNFEVIIVIIINLIYHKLYRRII